jgi:N-acetylglucosamine-6-phosphate deacetylase
VGLGQWLGRFAPGYRADAVALDPDTVEVLGTWVAGRDHDPA